MRKSLASLALVSPAGRFIADHRDQVDIGDMNGGSCFAVPVIDQLRGKSVLLLTDRQLPSVLAAIALDGVAKRILLGTPNVAPHLASIVENGQVDAIVLDDTMMDPIFVVDKPLYKAHSRIVSHGHRPIERNIETEWVIFTSGTTGQPKMVAHTLASLIGPINDGVNHANDAIWSTFYDVRRYGGLQILLRALLGGGSMVLSHADEAVLDFLGRLALASVTHISGTPSHWRRALMSDADLIAPAYVRLSGEIADQAILDHLRTCYPTAQIAHAFASTEAGVGFDVRDGLAGFPTSFVPHPNNNTAIELKIVDNTLRIRSARTATGYLGQALPEQDGFIDTGDLIEQRGERYYFVGRKEGVINVGGQKVFPEEVEEVITRHPDVLLARVKPRKNPITGAIVVADIVLRPDNRKDFNTVCFDLIDICQQTLAAYKVPVTWKQVDTIELTTSGKVQRGN
jgi:acyl-CoA synthetase (AMP-forming)/AMP-acid ligase II